MRLDFEIRLPPLSPIPSVKRNLLRQELEADQHPITGEITVVPLIRQERLDLFLATNTAAVVIKRDLGLEYFLGPDIAGLVSDHDDLAG